MTQDKARKTAARQRMAETGEPYTVARRAVQAGQPESGEDGQIFVRYRLARTFELVVDEEAWAKADSQTRARLIAEGAGQGSSHAGTTLGELIAHDLDERGAAAVAVATGQGPEDAAERGWEEEYYADGAASEGISVEEFKARQASGQARAWPRERSRPWADEAEERAQQRADHAQERADQAQERADQAQEQAEEARRRAGEAQDVADEARNVADDTREDGDRAAWERAERDVDRAQARADREQERAERERERAEHEQERADREQERADREQERAGADRDYPYHQPPSGMPRPMQAPHPLQPPRPPRPSRPPRLPRLPG